MENKKERLQELYEQLIDLLDDLEEDVPQHLKALFKGSRVTIEKAQAVTNLAFKKMEK